MLQCKIIDEWCEKNRNTDFVRHDIAHCAEKECSKACTCHRHLMYRLAVKKGLIGYDMMLPAQTPCELYWEENFKQ